MINKKKELGELILLALAAVICFTFSYAISIGCLPHNWIRMFYSIPLGLIIGWAEIMIGIACGLFLCYNIYCGLKAIKPEEEKRR